MNTNMIFRNIKKALAYTLVMAIAISGVSGFYESTGDVHAVIPAASEGKSPYLSKTSITLQRGKSAVISLINATGKVTYSSANKKIATVSKKGKIKAKKIGTTKIYAKNNKKKYKCSVKVTGRIYKLSKSSLHITKGKTAGVYLKNGKKKVKKGVSYKSDNKKIVTVSKKGKIKAKATGIATLTLTCEKRKYYCDVVVESETISHVKFSKKTITKTAKASKKTTLGTTKSNGYALTIPVGALDTDTKITIKSDGNNFDVSAAGKSHIRLSKPVTVQIKLKKKVSASDMINYRGVYYFGDKAYYIDLDGKKLKKGIAQFTTDHFSKMSAIKVARKHIVKNAAYLQAVNDYTLDTQNELLGKACESYVNSVLDEMGITAERGWGDYRSEINAQISKSGDYIALIRAAKNGDLTTFSSNAAQLVAKTLCSDLGDEATAAIGAIPEAITAARKGDFKGVLKTVESAVLMTDPYVKALSFYKSMIDASVDTWYNDGMEDAYKAYSGDAKQRGVFGYSGDYKLGSDEDWERLKTEMKGVYTKYLEKEMTFYKNANEISEDEWASNTSLQDTARKVADAKLRKEFEKRRDKDSYIDELAAKNESLIELFYEEGLVYHEDERPSWMDDEDEALTVRRLLNIKSSIESMFKTAGTTPAKAAGRTASANDKLYTMLVSKWVEKSWLTKLDDPGAGRKAVRDYIAKEWGVGVRIGDTVSSMKIGEKHQFNLYVETIKVSASKWSVSDKKAGSVSKTGLVKGIDDGDVVIYATYGKKKYHISVRIGEGNMELTPSKKTIYTGETISLTFKNSHGLSFTDIPVWKVSDKKLLSINSTGAGAAVKGLKKGKASVTVTYHKRAYKCAVTIKQALKLNKSSVTIKVGKSVKLKLKGVKVSKVVWGVQGSDGIVKVSKSGKVTGKKKGKAVVIAQVKGSDMQYKCNVTVKANKKKKQTTTSLAGTYKGKIKTYSFSMTTGEVYSSTSGNVKVVIKKSGSDYNIQAYKAQAGNSYYTWAYANITVGGLSASINYTSDTDVIKCDGKKITWNKYGKYTGFDGTTKKITTFEISATK